MPPPPPPITPDFIREVFLTVTHHAMGMVPKLQDTGMNLLLGLGTIMMAWTIVRSLLSDEGFPKIFVDTITLGFQVSIIAWLIKDLVPLSTALLGGFDWVAATLTGSEGGASALQAGMAGLMKIAINVWESIGVGGDNSWWESAKNLVAGGAAPLVIKLLTLALIMLITVVSGSIFVISQVLAGIGIALAPVFLPFYIIPALSKMADGVVQFIFKAGVMKTVGVVMLSFLVEMTSILEKLSKNWQGQENAAVLDLTAAIITLFVVAVMLWLSLQIPSIANGLLSGSVSGNLTIPRLPRTPAPPAAKSSK